VRFVAGEGEHSSDHSRGQDQQQSILHAVHPSAHSLRSSNSTTSYFIPLL
jgi:hypothetical protein